MPRGVTMPLFTEVSVGVTTQIGLAWQGVVDLLESAGWVVESSGDGLSSYSSSGKVFTNTTAGAANSYQNVNAWFVIRAPGAVGGNTRRHCVQILSLSNVGNVRAKYTANAAFSGGSPSATRVPSAVGEFVLRGGGTDAAPTGERLWSDQTAGTSVLVGVADAAAPYGFMFGHRRLGSTTDLEEMRFGMDPVVAYDGVPRTTDTDPVVLHAGSSSGAWLQSGLNSLTKSVSTTEPVYGLRPDGTTMGAYAVTTWQTASNTANIPDESQSAGTAFTLDGWSSKANLFPVLYASEAGGIKGVSTMLHTHDQEVTSAVADRQVLFSADGETKAYMKMLAFVIAWNGSDPINGASWTTVDADVWTLTTGAMRYRMRGVDGGNYVYWDASFVDSSGSAYTGGAVTDVVVVGRSLAVR